MERNKLLFADYIDIIFDGRNKAYGGYELRRRYAARARRATGTVILGAVILASLPVIAAKLSPDEARILIPVDRTTDLARIPVEVPKPPPALQPPHPVAPPPTIERPTFVITEDAHVQAPPKPNEDVAGIQPGLHTTTGMPGSDQPIIDGPTGAENVRVEQPVAPPIPTFVEQMPVFDGDLNQYLNAHLHYPEDARSAGEEGRPIIHFVVNEDGRVSDVSVVRKAAPSLDAEAMRVVGVMPRWRPGKQGGKAVKVYFTLPITFTLD